MEEIQVQQLKTAENLPTEKEYEKEIEMIEKTFWGSIFPLSRKEILRVFLVTITYFFVGLAYAFLRQFKDTVVYEVLGVQATNYLKVIVFFISFKVITTVSGLFNTYGINKGFSLYILLMGGTLFIYGLLVVFRYYINPLGWSEQILNGLTWDIRGLKFLKPFLMMLNHFIMVGYYVLSEVLGSTLMSYTFMTYLNNNVTPNQMTRYLRAVYIGANISLLITSKLVKTVSNFAERNFVASKKHYVSAMVFWGISLVLLITYWLKWLTEKEFQKSLYQGEQDKPKMKKKKKATPGIVETIMLTYQSSILFSMVVMSLGYNFLTTVAASLSQHVYKAYAMFLIMNPLENKRPGFIPTPSTVGILFKSNENSIVAMTVIFLMLTPLFALVFKRTGIFLFAFTTLLFCVVSTISALYYAAMNYPFGNFNKKILFGLYVPANEPQFEREAIAAATSNILIKIGKYAFYDLVKENVSTRIDPSDRALYKGVFDGVAAKAGKMLGSVYGIINENIFGANDARYTTPLAMIIATILAIMWVGSSIKLHRNYTNAVKNNTYLSEENVIKTLPSK